MTRLRPLLGIAIAGLALTGCASSSATPEPSKQNELLDGPFRPGPPCRKAEDCLEKGFATRETEPAKARVLFELACEKGSVAGCLELGKVCAGNDLLADVPTALRAFQRICQVPREGCTDRAEGTLGTLPICVPDACAWLVALEPNSRERIVRARRGCAMTGNEEALSRAVRARACLLVAEDDAATQRPVESRRAYQWACSLGDNAACKIAMATPAHSAAPSAAASTGVTIELASVDTDGFVMRDVSCALDDDNPVLGLFGGLTIGAGFAPQKAALQRCSPTPFEVHISWHIERQRVGEISCASRDPKINACVEKTLRGAPSFASGRCQATLLVDSKRAR